MKGIMIKNGFTYAEEDFHLLLLHALLEVARLGCRQSVSRRISYVILLFIICRNFSSWETYPSIVYVRGLEMRGN